MSRELVMHVHAALGWMLVALLLVIGVRILKIQESSEVAFKPDTEIRFELGKDSYLPNLKMKLIWCPPGIFERGGGNVGDRPIHPVRLTKGFWLAETETTQAQYVSLMGTNPSGFPNAGLTAPVEQVSWYDARAFLECLAHHYGGALPDGYVFGLPTEAQWEYACRAGLPPGIEIYHPPGPLNEEGDFIAPLLDELGWYAGNSGVDYAGGVPSHFWTPTLHPSKTAGTHPVAQKIPNPWGFYDMLGNVAEWCQDYRMPYYLRGLQIDPEGTLLAGRGRIYRGGAWYDACTTCRVFDRNYDWPDFRSFAVGLRVCIRPKTWHERRAAGENVEAFERNKINVFLETMAESQQPPEESATHTDMVIRPRSRWAARRYAATATIVDMWGVDDEQLWAVGGAGTILHGNGTSWEPQDSGTNAFLNAIWGADSRNIWAVGSSGVIRHWNGESWRPQVSGVKVPLRGIWGTGKDSVWAVGDSGTILRWDGSNWTREPLTLRVHLRGIWGSGPDNVWAVGSYGATLQWNGTGWRQQPSGTQADLRAIHGTSAQDIWAVGSHGTVLRWTTSHYWASRNTNFDGFLTDIWATESGETWITGTDGIIGRWAGIRWTYEDPGTTEDLHGIWRTSSKHVYVTGTKLILTNAPRP